MSSSPSVTPAIPGRQPLGMADSETRELIKFAYSIARTFKNDDEYLSAANLAVFDAMRKHKDGSGSLKSLVYWLTIRRCKGVRKREAVRSNISEPLTVKHEKILAPDWDNPAIRFQETTAVCSDPELAAALSEGMTQEEIAAERGISQQAISKRVGKLRKELAAAASC